MFITDLTDECGLGTHNCDVNALCINNDVSFSCECLSGFNGTGTNGTCFGNMNLLSTMCMMNFTIQSFKQLISDTQTGRQTHRQIRTNLIFMILDINECMENTYNCDTLATCVNNVGSYTCLCKNGYIGDGMPGNCRSKLFK